MLFQPSPGVFVALDTICTHLNIVPCNLNGSKLVCPQHGSEFALSTGAVINGPAVSPLARGIVSARADGFVWFEGDA
ncbi:MAG: Rieske (2Fe-2S) protein [Actinomycetes bacterium]